MKKSIEKFVALLSCITIMMSISSRVYADTSVVDAKEKFGIALCSSDKPIVEYPDNPVVVK